MILAGVAVAAGGVGLAQQPFAELEVVRGAPPAVAEEIALDGPFRLIGVVSGVRTYEAPLPIRPRALFFERAPDGMELRQGQRALYYTNDPTERGRGGSWEFSADSISVRVGRDAPRPQPGDYTLTYPRATAREQALFLGADDEAESFVRRSAQVDSTSRQGVYLPAPSRVAWDVEIPEAGVFRFEAGLLPPEVGDGTESDGAELIVTVDGTDEARIRVHPGGFVSERLDLGDYAGRKVRIQLQTQDEAVSRDHVFVADPVLYTPVASPRRVVLAFIDTLRRDHLGVYGYDRSASPKLDAWAKQAMVFDDARTVAPWTLPSARALLTGNEPENWREGETLQARLAADGWATSALVGNVYLSSNFDMAEGWGRHGCVNWPRAAYEVEAARRFLAENTDRDALLLVHFMDMHLPYKEPRQYRGLYAGSPPAGLGLVFNRNILIRAAMRQRDLVRQYLIDRYDQNLRYIDDELGGFLDDVGDNAIVAVFSDHGEEFFDHDSIEHGHSLYDELIRIPLVIRAPGATAGVADAPVSLVDLTPTILDLLGKADPSLHGRSLATVLRTGDDSSFAHRPRAFGRPLYGYEAWGAVRDGIKYTSTAGQERIIDVQSDPGELKDLSIEGVDLSVSRAALEDGLGRPVRLVYRFTPTGHSRRGASVEVKIPGGIDRWWIGDDPTRISVATGEKVDDETIRVQFVSRLNTHRELFVLPLRDPVKNVESVTMRFLAQDAPTPLRFRVPDGAGDQLGRARYAGWSLVATWGVIPIPEGETTPAVDDELRAALEALGYTVGSD